MIGVLDRSRPSVAFHGYSFKTMHLAQLYSTTWSFRRDPRGYHPVFLAEMNFRVTVEHLGPVAVVSLDGLLYCSAKVWWLICSDDPTRFSAHSTIPAIPPGI